VSEKQQRRKPTLTTLVPGDDPDIITKIREEINRKEKEQQEAILKQIEVRRD
jgi:hypothetical protein